jgi:hypothetical protein
MNMPSKRKSSKEEIQLKPRPAHPNDRRCDFPDIRAVFDLGASTGSDIANEKDLAIAESMWKPRDEPTL